MPWQTPAVTRWHSLAPESMCPALRQTWGRKMLCSPSRGLHSGREKKQNNTWSVTGEDTRLRVHEFRRGSLGRDGSGGGGIGVGPWEETGYGKGRVCSLNQTRRRVCSSRPLSMELEIELTWKLEFIPKNTPSCVYIHISLYIILSICISASSSTNSYQKHYSWVLLSWAQLQMDSGICVWI